MAGGRGPCRAAARRRPRAARRVRAASPRGAGGRGRGLGGAGPSAAHADRGVRPQPARHRHAHGTGRPRYGHAVADDVHHGVHAWVTGERSGYYTDFGSAEALRVVLERVFLHAGTWSSFRGEVWGAPVDPRSADYDAHSFVTF